MPALQKYNRFVQDLAQKALNLNSDSFALLLTNTAPAAGDATINTEIATGHGYTQGTGIALTGPSATQTGGTLTFSFSTTSATLTASGGTIGPFRYAVLVDVTASDKLIGWYDYGSSQTLNDGDFFTWNEGANVLTVA